jgi:hypothetical protein
MGDDRMIMLDVHCCVLAKGECVKREPEPRCEEIVGGASTACSVAF